MIFTGLDSSPKLSLLSDSSALPQSPIIPQFGTITGRPLARTLIFRRHLAVAGPNQRYLGRRNPPFPKCLQSITNIGNWDPKCLALEYHLTIVSWKIQEFMKDGEQNSRSRPGPFVSVISYTVHRATPVVLLPSYWTWTFRFHIRSTVSHV